MRRLLLTTALALLALGLIASTGAARRVRVHPPVGRPAVTGPPVPALPRLPGAWSHAEINVTQSGTPHTLILDRGRVLHVTLTVLRLRERDGSVAVVPLDVSTRVVLDGFLSGPAALRPGMNAETLRVDGGAAVLVVARGR